MIKSILKIGFGLGGIVFAVSAVEHNNDMCPKLTSTQDIKDFCETVSSSQTSDTGQKRIFKFQGKNWLIHNHYYNMLGTVIAPEHEKTTIDKNNDDYLILNMIEYSHSHEDESAQTSTEGIPDTLKCCYHALGTGRVDGIMTTIQNEFRITSVG